MGLMQKVFGDLNSKEVKKLEKIADQVLSFEDQIGALSDDELKAKRTEKLLTIFYLKLLQYVVKAHGEVLE